MTDLDTIIKKAAVHNGVGLRKDDPVMVLVTIMNTLIDDMKETLPEQQKRLLVNFAEKVEDSLQRLNTDMKGNTERSVNAVTDYAKGILPKVMTSGAAEAVKAAKSELSTMLADFDTTVGAFKRTVLACTAAILLSALVAVGLSAIQIVMMLKS